MQYFSRSKVTSSYLVGDPEHDLITLPDKLDQLESLLEPQSLVLEFTQQEFPQLVQAVKDFLDGDRGIVTTVDHVIALLVQLLNGITVGSNFSFKGLVFLDLGLEEYALQGLTKILTHTQF